MGKLRYFRWIISLVIKPRDNSKAEKVWIFLICLPGPQWAFPQDTKLDEGGKKRNTITKDPRFSTHNNHTNSTELIFVIGLSKRTRAFPARTVAGLLPPNRLYWTAFAEYPQLYPSECVHRWYPIIYPTGILRPETSTWYNWDSVVYTSIATGDKFCQILWGDGIQHLTGDWNHIHQAPVKLTGDVNFLVTMAREA